MPFRIEKVIGALPGTILPDTIYVVRTGPGFSLYVSDTTGSVAHSLNIDSGPTITVSEAAPSSPTLNQLWLDTSP